MTTLTTKQSKMLQSHLIEMVDAWLSLSIVKEKNLSLHICPDQTWIAQEHEKSIDDILIRKSPACCQIIIKL